MPGIINITLALGPLGKSADPAVLAQLHKTILAPCQDLVRIGLMSDIPHNLIIGKIQRQMQRHCELHYSQIAGKMPSCHADIPDQKTPYLLCKSVPLILLQLFYVIRSFNLIEQCHWQLSFQFLCI